MIKKINLDKIVAALLFPVMVWYMYPMVQTDCIYSRLILCFLVGYTIPNLWTLQGLLKVTKESGRMEERLRIYRMGHDWGVDLKDKK